MKKINLVLAALFVAVMSVTFLSCTKENEVVNSVTPEDQTVVEIPKYFVKDGILVFNSREDLNELNAYFEDKSSEFIDNWENEIGFTSQQSILEQAINEEDAYYEQFDATTLTEEQIEVIVAEKEKMGYTEFTKKYIAEGIIKPYITDDINSLELTTFSWVGPRFLNLDGIVAVNDTIYQFTETQCKKLTDGDFSKIELLKKTTLENLNGNIEVGNSSLYKSSYHYRINNGYKSLDNGSKWGCKMIVGEVWIKVIDWISYKDYVYYVKYMNYKANLFGVFKEDDNADTEGSGSVVAKVTGEISNTYYLNFSHDNKWAYNFFVFEKYNVPISKTITFSLANFVMDRDGLSSISIFPDNVTH